jgi:redox-sensitive bicupin YhaK (pirin superfamily)
MGVEHALPKRFARPVGPFVFLEHILSYDQALNEVRKGLIGIDSNPYRGIAILTYGLSGAVEHMDSLGNHVKLRSGGVHWTKAGKGIVKYEIVRAEFRAVRSGVSVVRVWINLPSKHKSEKPAYLAVSPGEIPKQKLAGGAGWIKILLGEYEEAIAKIPYYSKEFLYHIHLKAGRQFSLVTETRFEYAAFLPANRAVINNSEFQTGELIMFTIPGEFIEIKNKNETAINLILFGGEPYRETIVSEGNFVMNTPHEITQAYNDYYDGKYGRIKP